MKTLRISGSLFVQKEPFIDQQHQAIQTLTMTTAAEKGVNWSLTCCIWLMKLAMHATVKFPAGTINLILI